MYKFVILASIFAFSCAHYVPSSYHTVVYHPAEWKKYEETTSAPVEVKAPEIKEPEYKAPEIKEPEIPANFDYKYEVHDEKTGDLKRHEETALNGAIKGQYSLIDSDGFKRIVEYTADAHNGFQATVKREPTHYKIPEPVKYVEVIPHEKWW